MYDWFSGQGVGGAGADYMNTSLAKQGMPPTCSASTMRPHVTCSQSKTGKLKCGAQLCFTLHTTD